MTFSRDALLGTVSKKILIAKDCFNYFQSLLGTVDSILCGYNFRREFREECQNNGPAAKFSALEKIALTAVMRTSNKNVLLSTTVQPRQKKKQA